MKGVLVAGGTGALGSAVARTLLEAGYPVTSTWVLEPERDRAQAELEGRDDFSLVEADLFDPDSAEAAVNSVENLGAVVDLVGGYGGTGRVHETDPEDFDRLLRLNLRPAFLLARSAMPRLMEGGGGAFVAVSARAALEPFGGAAGYVTAKAAVLAFIRALDKEYLREGIRCNVVLPSVIDTPANRRDQPDADHSKWVAPERIGDVIRFLISEESGPVSGAAIPVYGRA